MQSESSSKRLLNELIGCEWSLWNKKDYRVFRKADWDVSYTRSLSLLQWALDNPARHRGKGKKKKHKMKVPITHPRDTKRTPSKREFIDKLAEPTVLVKTFVREMIPYVPIVIALHTQTHLSDG